MMIDRLEPRLQFASLSGTVFNDPNGSETFDKGEKVMGGVTVFLDDNKNGTLDAGEQSTASDSTGRYTFTGLSTGTYTVATTEDAATMRSTTAGLQGSVQGRYDITFTGLDRVAPAFRAAFMEAAKRWKEVITGALPAATLDDGTTTTGIRIAVTIPEIDGVGGIEGQSNYTTLRSGSNLPSSGFIELDEADLISLRQDGHLVPVIEHEMAHVMGFGTIWDTLGLVQGNPNRNPRYVGENATREYDDLFNSSNLSVPAENTGYEGTADAHWRESVLTTELMTGYDNPGQDLPLSRITVGEFQDEGYEVNYKAADGWDPTTEAVDARTPADLGAVANERTIRVFGNDHVRDMDFGYLTLSPPVIGSLAITPTPVAAGQDVTLTARKLSDPNGVAINLVRFYRESNGVEGLQPGSDTLVSTKRVSKGRTFSAQVGTTGLSGDVTFYALATDTLGSNGRRAQTVNVETVTTPPDAPQQVFVRQRTSTIEHLSFTDDSVGVASYRIQLATSSSFARTSIVQDFLITPDELFVNLRDLKPGVRYYVRLRGQNTSGVSPFSQLVSFETT